MEHTEYVECNECEGEGSIQIEGMKEKSICWRCLGFGKMPVTIWSSEHDKLENAEVSKNDNS